MLALLALAGLSVAGAQATQTSPAAVAGTAGTKDEYSFVKIDELGRLSPEIRGAADRILSQHEMLTGERIFLVLLKGRDHLAAEARLLLERWCPDPYLRKSCLVLVHDYAENEALIEAGVTFDGSLGPAQRERIIEDIFEPELRAGNADRAVAVSVYQILRSVNSPLIASGVAENLLRAAGFDEALRPQDRGIAFAWDFWLLFGLFLAGLAFFILTAAEMHYTGQGWFRPSPWSQLALTFARFKTSGTSFQGGGEIGHWGS